MSWKLLTAQQLKPDFLFPNSWFTESKQESCVQSSLLQWSYLQAALWAFRGYQLRDYIPRWISSAMMTKVEKTHGCWCSAAGMLGWAKADSESRAGSPPWSSDELGLANPWHKTQRFKISWSSSAAFTKHSHAGAFSEWKITSVSLTCDMTLTTVDLSVKWLAVKPTQCVFYFISQRPQRWDKSPHVVGLEELHHQGGRCSRRVRLANSGYLYGPWYSAREAHPVGVNATSWRKEEDENSRSVLQFTVSPKVNNGLLYESNIDIRVYDTGYQCFMSHITASHYYWISLFTQKNI